jgi:hypothetical protein
MRVSRTYQFEDDECIIISRVENVAGPVRTAALWNVTNIDRPAATYLLPAPNSAHPAGYHEYRPGLPPLNVTRLGGVLIVRPSTSHIQKLGCDTPTVAIAAQRAGELFIQRAESLSGVFPHGGNGAGSSVEYYDNGDTTKEQFVELELLGPLIELKPGHHSSLVVRWRIAAIPATFPGSATDAACLESWLTAPVARGPGNTNNTSLIP